jgi:thiosulfate dehydrogenase (quinone) large subunit
LEKKSAQSLVVPVLLFILAYEWIISSINKMATKNYYENLHQQMAQSVSGVQFQPYASLLKNIGLPHYHLFGTLVLLAELFVGLTFVVIGIRKLQGKSTRVVGRFGIIASIVAAFMSLNYALLGGDTLFVDPANAFQEGISIDWILFLIEVTLVFYFYHVANQSSKVQ